MALTGLTAIAGVVLSSALAAPAQAANGDILEIVNANSGQCLAIGAASTAKGAGAIQWPCNGHMEQQWYQSNSRLINVNSGQCLAIGAGSDTAGAQLIQWPCKTTSAPEQDWFITLDDWRWTGYYFIQNRNSLKYAAIGAGSKANGAHVIQWYGPNLDTMEQRWGVYVIG